LVRHLAEVERGWFHMVEEYARHNGHADLLRQGIDGAVGQEPPPLAASRKSCP
jgi:Protein of unknown function (DUF664)